MLEKLIFSDLVMPGETFRIAIALLGTAVATYFDIFNNRNIPNGLLYAFLGVALLTALIFFDMDIFVYGAGLSAILFVLGFALYKSGQIGGADLFVVCAITLLLPVHPSSIDAPFNYPLIFSALLYSGVAFALYSVFFFGRAILKCKKAKPNYPYLVLLLPYLFFSYIFISAPFFSMPYFLMASALLLSSVFFLVFRQPINESVMENIPLSRITDEDVLVKEKMHSLMERLKIGPVIGGRELAILKKAKIRKVWVYTSLPPFLPFLLLGLIASILVGGWVLLAF